jgi:hypothetical protein
MSKQEISDEINLFNQNKIDYTFLRVRDLRELYRRKEKAWLDEHKGEIEYAKST